MGSPRFEIRPLGLWGRAATPADQRQSSRLFRAPWTDTVKLLIREVDKLDGQIIVVQIDVTASQIRRDGMLYAAARANTPAVKVSFDSRHGPLTYATDQFDHWQANVRAIALSLEALRAVDRYGVSHSGEQYRGWSQISAAPAETELTVQEAARILGDAAGVDPATLVSKATVRTAFREAVQRAHPDRGGDPAVFRLITRARDVLLGSPGDVS